MDKYELFKMNENESIYQMLTRFIDIVNGIKALDKDVSNVKLVNKISYSIPRSSERNVTTILEAKDLKAWSLPARMFSQIIWNNKF